MTYFFLCLLAAAAWASPSSLACLEAPLEQLTLEFPQGSRRQIFGHGGRFELVYQGPFDSKKPVAGPGYWLSATNFPMYLGEGFTLILDMNPQSELTPGLLVDFESKGRHLLEIFCDEKGAPAVWGFGHEGSDWSISFIELPRGRPRQISLTFDCGYLRLFVDGIFRSEGQSRAPLPLAGAYLAVHHRGGAVPTISRLRVFRRPLGLDGVRSIFFEVKDY